jgi:hypothetical protein
MTGVFAMITLKELNPHNHPLTHEQQQNLPILLERMNRVRTLYAKPMLITSGVRSVEDQTRIDGAAGRKPRVGSMHLRAAACDVWDRDRHLWGWVMDNLKLMEEIGLWLEDKSKTPTWVHFQIYPPKSGNRIFLP